MKAEIIDLAIGLNGKQRLTVELDGDFRNDYDELHGKPVSITIKRYRAKRSLDANGYCWALIDQIAQKMRLPKSEVYKQAIREIGGVSETICVQDRAVPKIKEMWEENGTGWQVEEMPSKIAGCTVLTLYYGSSKYDTAQMSALIDQITQTARSIGIEPRQDIKQLLEGY